MTSAELKLKIFRQIDLLDKNTIEEFYGILLNFVHGKSDSDSWSQLSAAQKKGILAALDEVKAGKTIKSDQVLAKHRKKYLHG